MLSTLAEWSYQQVDRYGRWVLAVPVALAALVVVLTFYLAGAYGRQSGWPSEEEQRAIDARRMAEDKIENDALVALKANQQAREEAAKSQAARQLRQAAIEPAVAAAKQAPTPVASTPSPLDLPGDLAAWTENDFFLARQIEDGRFAAALEARGKTRVGKESEARFLARLLDPAIPDEVKDRLQEAARLKKAQSPAAARLVQDVRSKAFRVQIAAALGVNGTTASAEALARMASGGLGFEDPRAAEAAVKALVENVAPQNEAVLLKLLLVPPDADKAAAAARTALSQRLVASLKSSASRRLRLEIARKIIDPTTPAEIRAPLGEIVRDTIPVNFDAQLVIFRGAMVAPETRAAIERFFLACGSEALGWTLGVPDRPNSGTTADWPPFVVRRLWRDEFAELTRRRIEAARSLQEAAGTIAMAATAPTDAMRQCLAENLLRHWEDGPAALATAASGSRPPVFDPGWVLVLKTVERRIARARTSASSAGRFTAKDAQSRKRWEDFKTQTREQWGKAAGEAVRGQCAVFHAIALGREETARVTGGEPPEEVSPPIPLHPNARVMAAVQVDLSKLCEARVPGLQVDPLQVTYLRAEGRQSPMKLLQWYRRHLRGCEARKLPDGAWLDAILPGEEGRKRSIDVRIVESKPIAGRPPEEEREMTVDILAIEVRDPMDRTDAEESPAAP